MTFLIAHCFVPAQAIPAADGTAIDAPGIEAQLKLAREHRIAGRTDQALGELAALLESLRRHPELRDLALNVERETAEAYLARRDPSGGDLRRAAACLEHIAAEQPKDAFAHYRLGLIYRELGDNRRAALNLQDAVRGGYRNLGGQVNLIEAAFASGQSALALRTAVKVITPDLRSPELLMRLGKLLFDHLFYKEALTAFQLARAARPDAFEPRFRLALTHYLLKEYAQASDALQPASVFQTTAEAASLAASAEAQLGHIEAATSILRHAMEQSPESPHPYVNLALIELDRGNTAEAETLLERLRSLPVQLDVKVFYTVNRNSCRELANAVEHREASGHPSPDKARFYYQLGVQLQERFHYASAVELIRLAQANEGNSARVLYVAGASCLNLDPQAPEPLQFLRQAVAVDPAFDKAWYMLGRAYTRRGDMEEARRSFEKAAQLRADPSYFLDLGRALAKSGNSSDQDRARAITACRQALALDPGYAEAHLELGRMLVQTQDLEDGRRELAKALELEPDFYLADYLLGRLYYQMGEKDRGQEYMKSFEEKKGVLMGQSVIGSGFIFDGQ